MVDGLSWQTHLDLKLCTMGPAANGTVLCAGRRVRAEMCDDASSGLGADMIRNLIRSLLLAAPSLFCFVCLFLTFPYLPHAKGVYYSQRPNRIVVDPQSLG